MTLWFIFYTLLVIITQSCINYTVHLTSSHPGVNQSICKDVIRPYIFLCEAYNITGNESTLRWSFYGTINVTLTFTPNDPVGTPKEHNSPSYRVVSVLTPNSIRTTPTNGDGVNFASCLIVQPLWNHDNDTQQAFKVSCEIDTISNKDTQPPQTSCHNIEGMQ